MRKFKRDSQSAFLGLWFTDCFCFLLHKVFPVFGSSFSLFYRFVALGTFGDCRRRLPAFATALSS